jgi:hypothetical protein
MWVSLPDKVTRASSAVRPTLDSHARRYDCEDRQRSLMVLGCGLVTTGVTPGMTGFCALLRPVRLWSPAPARLEELA